MFKFAICLLTILLPFSSQAEQTLSLIKPDAVEAQHIGDIIAKFEKEHLRVAALKMTRLTKEQAQKFYSVHNGKPFFDSLTEYMSSGPLVAIVLEGNNAVQKNRDIMGATDPKKANAGTIRASFATSITKNAVHGSDSVENAKLEIPFFFSEEEIY